VQFGADHTEMVFASEALGFSGAISVIHFRAIP
jgi:hypothetical protein